MTRTAVKRNYSRPGLQPRSWSSSGDKTRIARLSPRRPRSAPAAAYPGYHPPAAYPGYHPPARRHTGAPGTCRDPRGPTGLQPRGEGPPAPALTALCSPKPERTESGRGLCPAPAAATANAAARRVRCRAPPLPPGITAWRPRRPRARPQGAVLGRWEEVACACTPAVGGEPPPPLPSPPLPEGGGERLRWRPRFRAARQVRLGREGRVGSSGAGDAAAGTGCGRPARSVARLVPRREGWRGGALVAGPC